MGKKDYDKLAARFAIILSKLENEDRPTKESLAEEFNVSTRTIERDLNRLNFFPIEKNSDKSYSFQEGFSLNRVSFNDIEKLLIYLTLNSINSVNSSFFNASNIIKSKLLTPDFKSSYMVKHDNFETLDLMSEHIRTIEKAIHSKRLLNFMSKNINYIVEPYKIMALDGLWYLMAENLDTSKYQIFIINDLEDVEISQRYFEHNIGVASIIESIQTHWYEDNNEIDVIVEVSKEISQFFKRKKHLPSQEIKETKENGNLIVCFKVTNEEEVDNLIKAWLPHVKVIEPIKLHTKIINDLKQYIGFD